MYLMYSSTVYGVQSSSSFSTLSLSLSYTHNTHTHTHTLSLFSHRYMPPEAMDATDAPIPMSTLLKWDVYACGVVIAEVMLVEPPFSKCRDPRQVMCAVQLGRMPYAEDRLRSCARIMDPPKLLALLIRMMCPDHARRPFFRDISADMFTVTRTGEDAKVDRSSRDGVGVDMKDVTADPRPPAHPAVAAVDAFIAADFLGPTTGGGETKA